jgi:chromosome segregation ATPase
MYHSRRHKDRMAPGVPNLNTAGSVDNWKYDRYKDPHEFPLMDLTSDDDEPLDQSVPVTNSSTQSKKIPMVSDEKFKEILELRKKTKQKISQLNNISDSNRKEERDIPHLAPQRLEPTQEFEENKATLSSSTPKVNNFVNPSSPNREVVSNLEQKNLTPFLTNDNGMVELLNTIKEQTLLIHELELKLTKKDIAITNFESEVVKLKHDNAVLGEEKESLRLKVVDVQNKDSVHNTTLTELRSENEKLKSILKSESQQIENLENSLEKTTLLLSKEQEISQSVISNYNSKLDKLKKDRNELIVEADKGNEERMFWVEKAKLLEKEVKSQVEKLQNIQDANAQLKLQLDDHESLESGNSDLKSKVKSLTNENESLKADFKSKVEFLTKDNEALKADLNTASNRVSTLQSELSQMSTRFEALTTENFELRAELSAKTQLTGDEMNRINSQRRELEKANRELELTNLKLTEEMRTLKVTLIGNEEIAITEVELGDRYRQLEMKEVDGLSLVEARNVIKNVLSTLNIKYSELKVDMVFTRDHIYVFFDEIHNLLHAKKVGNSIVINNTVKLNIFDQNKMIKCMDILIEDVKGLKGIQ